MLWLQELLSKKKKLKKKKKYQKENKSRYSLKGVLKRNDKTWPGWA